MIFHFKTTQNLVAEHFVRDFEIIFYYKADQNLVAEHYERDFDTIFHFKQFNTWLQSTVREILTWFSTLW